MKKYEYIPSGVCSSKINFSLTDDDKIIDIEVKGGCAGNSLGISALCKDKNIDEIIPLLENIKCGFKQTSCPDQISKALKQYKNEKNNKLD